MNESQQLPLNLKSSSNNSFDNFVVGKNELSTSSLKSFIESEESLFYLWGVSGSGKSHVLQALVRLQNTVIISSVDIAKRENISLISLFDTICIDNLENIAGNNKLEVALFTWVNEVKQANKKIILSSQISNKSDTWQLPDLKSRIQSGQTHEFKVLGREQSLYVFEKQAKQHGLIIDSKVKNYINNNCSLNMKYLSRLLIQLDEVTLVQKKAVTIPLLKKIIDTNVVN